MILQLPYPNIDPVFLRIGPLQLRWYGLMYMLAFIIGYFVLKRYAKQQKAQFYDGRPLRPAVLSHSRSDGRRPARIRAVL